MWEDNRGWALSLDEALIWITNSYFVQKRWFEVENVLMIDLFLKTCSFLLHKMLINGLFGLSFWRHPFTAEDPLLSKWCRLKLNFSKYVSMKKQTHLHLRWLQGVYIISKFSFLGGEIFSLSNNTGARGLYVAKLLNISILLLLLLLLTLLLLLKMASSGLFLLQTHCKMIRIKYKSNPECEMIGSHHTVSEFSPLLKVSSQTVLCGLKTESTNKQLPELLRLLTVTTLFT